MKQDPGEVEMSREYTGNRTKARPGFDARQDRVVSIIKPKRKIDISNTKPSHMQELIQTKA